MKKFKYRNKKGEVLEDSEILNAGFSMYELAIASQITRGALTRVSKGERIMQHATYLKLLRGYNMLMRKSSS